MAEQVERRKHRRTDVQWPVTVLTERGAIEGEAVNMASEGLSIRCDEPLRLNETYQMSVLPPNHELIEFTGKVLWSEFYGLDDQNSPCGMGICFVEIAGKDHHFLTRLESELEDETQT